MSKNSGVNPLLLALSGVPRDILPLLFLTMMMNRFLKRQKLRWIVQQPDDPVLIMLRRILYSDHPFVDHHFRMMLIQRFGMSFFLLDALMCPGMRIGANSSSVHVFFLQGIDRVKRRISSQPQQIERVFTMLSNPFFQTPPFHLSFSIKRFSDWDQQLRFNLMKFLLLSVRENFDGLPEFLVLVRQLMITENPFWIGLVDVFISNYFDNRDQFDDLPENCPLALQKLLTDIESSSGSNDLLKFEGLFQPTGSVPNDRNSFLQVFEQFVTCMIQILPSLPGIRFENDVIIFSPITKLSLEGLALSARIRQILGKIHSLSISEKLINLLTNKNYEDSTECLAYRGFEILLTMLKLIQNSNGAIYTFIHHHILIETSAQPDERRKLCAIQDLFNIVRNFVIDNGEDDFEKYMNLTFSMHSYLHSGDDIIPFLMDFLLSKNFLQTLEVLLLCSDYSELEVFAKNFMNNSEFVVLFRRYIQENPKTWCRA
jgi:hypothetical protein